MVIMNQEVGHPDTESVGPLTVDHPILQKCGQQIFAVCKLLGL